VTTPVTTPPTTASQSVSVLPTKVSSTPKTSVLGTKAASQLPHTGNSLPVTALVVISLGLLAGGGALVAAPAVGRSKKTRRH
jgi:type III secretory pathway component EscV